MKPASDGAAALPAASRIALKDGGVSVSRLIAGCWRLRAQSGDDAGFVRRFIEHALALGITTFDHADIYGAFGVEALFGQALRGAPGLRERIELVTKCDIAPVLAGRPENRVLHLDSSAAYIRAAVEKSLGALGTDRIDVMLLHRPDPLMHADEVAGEMTRLQGAGKVRSFGVSNFTPSQFDLLQSRLPFALVTNQIEASVLRPQAFIDGTLDDLQKRDIAAMIWSPLGGGNLFRGVDVKNVALLAVLLRLGAKYGLTPAAVAIAWLLRAPARMVPILGTATPERLTQAAQAVRIDMDRQDWFEIYTAAGAVFA